MEPVQVIFLALVATALIVVAWDAYHNRDDDDDF